MPLTGDIPDRQVGSLPKGMQYDFIEGKVSVSGNRPSSLRRKYHDRNQARFPLAASVARFLPGFTSDHAAVCLTSITRLYGRHRL